MELRLLNEIGILNPETVNIVSNGTHIFSSDDTDYAVRYHRQNNIVLIDFYRVEVKNGNRKFIQDPLMSKNYTNDVWSKLLTSISLYIENNNPETLKILCGNDRLMKFYDHMFLYLKRFKQFNGYLVDKEVTKFGNVYTISRTDNKFIKLVEKYING